MIKRHSLVLVLFCLSILVGITIAVLETVTAFFFTTGILVLPGIATVFFVAAILSWLALKKKSRTRDPERSVRYQSSAFGTWFAAHNLFWTLIGSFSIWGLFKLFGFKPWVVVFSAGTLACACFAFLGIFFIPQKKMLGLCWQSPIPEGLDSFWARAGAAVVLRDRYEYAAEHDQKKSSPLLWSISRIFERSTSGGADRGIDLMETHPAFLTSRLKKEWLHRLKVLLVLFWITVTLAALPGLLGIVPHYWDRFPDNWPSDKIKKTGPEKSPVMTSKSQPNQSSRENQTRDKDRQSGQDQEKTSNSENKQSKPGEPGQNKQESGGSNQDKSNREQGSKESGDKSEKESRGQGSGDSQPGSSNRELENKENEKRKNDANLEQTGRENRPQDQKGKDSRVKGSSEKRKGETSQDRKGEGNTGQQTKDSGKDNKGDNQSGGTGQDKSKTGQSKPGQEGKGSESKGKEAGQGQGKEQGGSDSQPGRTNQEQKGTGECQGGGQKSKPGEAGQGGAGQGQGSKSSHSKGEGKDKGESESQGSGKDKSPGPGEGTPSEQKSEPGQGQTAGKGAGEGQGLGSPDATPEMKAEPDPLPQIPSRATKMVNLELPPLTETPTKGKESGDSQKETTPGQVPVPKAKAPTEKFKTGEQERSASRPEQYLPNWILNIIKKSHGLTQTNTDKKENRQ